LATILKKVRIELKINLLGVASEHVCSFSWNIGLREKRC